MQLVSNKTHNDANRRLIDSACRELARSQQNLKFTLEDIAVTAKLPIDVVTENSKNSRGFASVTTIIERVFITQEKQVSNIFVVYLTNSTSMDDVENGIVECVRQLCFLTRNDPIAKVFWTDAFNNGHLHTLGLEVSNQRGQIFIDRLSELAPHWDPHRLKMMVTVMVQSIYQTAKVVQNLPEKQALALIAEAERIAVMGFRDSYCCETPSDQSP